MSWSLLLRGPGRGRRPAALAATACFGAGGVLLLWSAYVHFHLWGETDGYRSIATIGPLFLVQSIAGLVIGLGVIIVRRVWAAVVGVGFALSTIGGFLVSVVYGLFGFKESWLAPYAKEAFVVEVVAAALARRRCGPLPRPIGSPHSGRRSLCRQRDVGTTPDRARVPSPGGRGPGPAQRRPAKRSSSGTGAPVGVADPHEALRAHEVGEQLLPHLRGRRCSRSGWRAPPATRTCGGHGATVDRGRDQLVGRARTRACPRSPRALDAVLGQYLAEARASSSAPPRCSTAWPGCRLPRWRRG